MKLATLHDLFVHELKDLYSAENQIIKALPKMIKAASSESLKEAFEKHLEVTKAQLERLTEVFEQIEASPGRMKCQAMEGLIAECQDMIKEKAAPEVLDAALIAGAQRIEHYEISGYGTARTYAEHLGFDDAAALLQETLDEEKETDVELTSLAESEINVEAEAPS